MEHYPILNSPYLEPNLQYATGATGEEKGSLDYTRMVEGRRSIDHPERHFNTTTFGIGKGIRLKI
jgi:hypothetical protein